MLRKLLIVALAAWAAPALAQLTPSGFLLWDYNTANFSLFSISRFELQLDSAAFVSVGIPATRNDAQTEAGSNTYGVAASGMIITVGNHTFSVRACSVAQCSLNNPVAGFTFSVPPPPPPVLAPPRNLRVLP